MVVVAVCCDVAVASSKVGERDRQIE